MAMWGEGSRFLVVLLFALGLWACEQGEEVLPGDGADLPVDTLESDGGDVPGAEVDVSVVDPDVLIPDVTPDAGPGGCEAGTGCFGDPCDENADCLSELCMPHLGDQVCSRPCESECPEGWLCQSISGPDADVTFACTSSAPSLCLPCASNSDCGVGPGATAVCVDGGASGSFCGAGCGDDAPCPAGYDCQDVGHVGGGTASQCVPAEGGCACSEHAVDLGLSTPCIVENDHGICAGHRVCTDDGLTACDAPEPMEEICDGQDNDCDGEIDEVDCDDSNACTLDTCAGETGCLHDLLTGGECLDGDPCTAADHCEEGVCVGTPILCDDENPCTDDACDDLGGCAFTPNLAPCDDEDACTVADTCDPSGACLGLDLGCECVTDADCGVYEDGDQCNGTLFCDTSALPFRCEVDPVTVVTCDPPPGGPDAICQKATCDPETGACAIVADHEGFACDDGDVCTLGEACVDAVCVGGMAPNCSDGEPCTDDSCVPGVGCTHVANQAPCEDGDPCTVGDLCSGGGCQAGGQAFDCDDKNPCTQDSCDPAGGCIHAPVGGPCDDGNACTVGDACVAGVCSWTNVLVCNDGNLCTDDGCHPASGCVYTPLLAPCEDGEPCTVGDQCHDGECVGGASAPDCDDGELCTDDSCEPGVGCTHTANLAACDDGNPCTLGDTCAGGQCASSEALVCDDGNPCTDDSCQPETGCSVTPNSAPCDDQSACTTQDTCSGGSCAGSPVSCDDGVACTSDSCDATSGCVNTPQAELCPAGGLCAQAVCVPGVGCEVEGVANCCGNGVIEGDETCDDGNAEDGDGCTDCGPDACYDDWLVGTPCNGTDYGNGCTPDLTGYHYKGTIDGFVCWWHTRNQAWNTDASMNFYHLAQQFGLDASEGHCDWCSAWDTPFTQSPVAGSCSYLSPGQVGAWGWCAESAYWHGGHICFPSTGLQPCGGASNWP